MGQRYRSCAVVPDGTPEPPTPVTRSSITIRRRGPGPGCPTAGWATRGHKVCTHDVVGKGRFALLTGVSGRRWADAARAVSGTSGSKSRPRSSVRAGEHIDLYDDWARLREVGEDGCVLVRPDAHVAWRAAAMAESPERELEAALRVILDRPVDDGTQGSTNSAGSLVNPAATAAS